MPRTEMLDVVDIGGRARGIITRNLVTKVQSSAMWLMRCCFARAAYGSNVFPLSMHKVVMLPPHGEHVGRILLPILILHQIHRVFHCMRPVETDADEREPPAERRARMGAETRGQAPCCGHPRQAIMERKLPPFGNLVPPHLAT